MSTGRLERKRQESRVFFRLNFNHVYTDVDNREKANSRNKKKERKSGTVYRCKNNMEILLTTVVRKCEMLATIRVKTRGRGEKSEHVHKQQNLL